LRAKIKDQDNSEKLKLGYSVKNPNKIKVNAHYVPTGVDVDIAVNPKSDQEVSISEINTVREISKLEKIKTCSEYFASISSHLNVRDNDIIRWDLIAGKEKSKEYFEYIKRQLQYSQNLFTSYYYGLYQERVLLYKDLSSVLLNDKVLEAPTYNHASVTGRTSITSGTNFLTMSKDKRRMLRSVKKDHTLVEIDLKSCEPNFYLKALGRTVACSDVYQDVADKLGLKINDRARFKRGILSVLYGAKDSTSKNMLKCTFTDLKKIKEYFQIDSFKSYLEDEFKKNGVIYNYYGRPICFDNSLVNYWIQSSSVDFCSFAFAGLIKDFNLDPCFFVHDSMTISVHNNDIDKIKELNHVYDKHSNMTIPVEVSVPSL
jgi:hypothetical protein